MIIVTLLMEKNINYKKIGKSLGELMEFDSTLSELESNNIFGAEVTSTIQNSTEYFIWRTLHLYYNGKCEDIKFADFTFSYIVKSEYYSHFYKGTHHKISISGLLPNGDKFIFEKNQVPTNEDLVNAVFAMVIITECKDLTEANTIWDILSSPFNYGKIENCIIEISKIKEFAKTALSKYPFLRQSIKECLHSRVEYAQKNIAQLGLLEDAL